MVAVLGVSAHYHDAAAALVVDGEVVAAIQEERLSRQKNDASLPKQAMTACLDFGGLKPGDLDAVVFYETPYGKLERVLTSAFAAFPRAWRQFPQAVGAQLGHKLWVLDTLREWLDVPRHKVRCIAHHTSHAASAFFSSPYEHAAVLTVDGVGETDTTAIHVGHRSALTHVESLCYPHSLGLFYAALTSFLGFRVNEGEYKVMGLAAYGTPRFREAFASLIHLSDDGSFQLELSYFGYHSHPKCAYSSKLVSLLGPPRLATRPWDLTHSEDQHYADIAATLQRVTEEALLGLARRAHQQTNADFLCLAGGVALNSVANQQLADKSPFKEIFVQPAAGDAGGALGAAMLGAIQEGSPRPLPLTSAALGLPVDVGRAYAVAKALGLPCQRVQDPHGMVASHIAAGKFVGFVQGRFEWGPRALGQRSLLAHPSDSRTKDRLNRIKKRAWFRPFAPSVLAEHTTRCFTEAPDAMTSFMARTMSVREQPALLLDAVTHVDGTARVQTVSRTHHAGFASVLDAVGKEIGTPIVLNTSLNGAGSPIVGSAEDALDFFLQHKGVDALMVEDVWIHRDATKA